jgi:hypothetical protein
MTKKLNISKITDKEEILDVQGQGCTDDCTRYTGNQSLGAGCQVRVDCYMTCTF